MRARLLGLTLLAACGRLGFEPIQTETPAHDAGLDAPSVCPGGTVVIAPGARTCIEMFERGYDNWTNARAMCVAANMRLCSGAEWVTACQNATGLVDFLSDNWEWVSDTVDANNAEKRGGSNVCTDISSHVITDPYEVRCCTDI